MVCVIVPSQSTQYSYNFLLSNDNLLGFTCSSCAPKGMAISCNTAVFNPLIKLSSAGCLNRGSLLKRNIIIVNKNFLSSHRQSILNVYTLLCHYDFANSSQFYAFGREFVSSMSVETRVAESDGNS